MTSPTSAVTTAAVPCCGSAHLRHCHGTWIVHADETQSCSDPGCGTPGEAHALIMVCADLEPGCRCLPAAEA
ncbi:hypothetical protein EXU48_19330 [Occultella glacieicola]|uniref:Uncharacterized protein n=1 Tax=Occultella glacieicola TaxID=2518684 RepID=A0ABY2DZE9_9MICO|nr:hypothetical protein [Occultella glacieicola]TDE90069.1 hypothetical protein EXU48_19330 [Occultella glacieicola]